MVTLNQLEVLLRVLEHQGFSGAAKSLFMSQPSVSNHIRNLENSCGIQLVHRTSAGARPTPAGEVVAEHARQVFAIMDSLERTVADFRGLGGGRLVLAGTTTLGTYLLPRLVADFSTRAPKVSCEIRVGNEDAVESWLLRGRSPWVCAPVRPAMNSWSPRACSRRRWCWWPSRRHRSPAVR